MRNRNPSLDRSRRQQRGENSALRAGPRGHTLRDSNGNEAHPVTDILFVGATVTDADDGVGIVTIGGGAVTVIGEVAPDDTTNETVADAAAHEAFPGVAWLDDPTGTIHGVGDRFLIVYRSASSHLTNGNIVGKIGTITDTNPWTYTLGAVFIIYNIANDVRCDDGVSVLDIGDGTYHAVVAGREFTGGPTGVNQSPFILICDDVAASMTSGSTWTRHNFALSGHTQDFIVDRVHLLANGRYMVCFQIWNGATHTGGVAWTTDITDWSAPTFVNINSSTSLRDEMDFEETSPGTLYCNIRNDTTNMIESSVSTDSGDTWSAITAMFSGTHFPTWRVLNSGLGLILYGSMDGSFDTAYRQTVTGATDDNWGAESILYSDVANNAAYGTILQLDDNHVLIIYALEIPAADPTFADIYSIIMVDSTVFGDAGTVTALVAVSSGDTADYLGVKVVAGSGITVTTLTPGTHETLEVAATFDGTAADVSIADAGAYYTSATAEGALQEIGASLATASATVAALPLHAHVVEETHLSDGSTTTWTLDHYFEPGSVIAWNTTTIARLTVTEVAPDQATVSAAGTTGDKIVFDYATPLA